MANKVKNIRALSVETAQEITQTPENWMQFLDTASRIYKYPFHEQMLIYAQRPDAIACAPIEVWNKNLHRWVNRGSKGIALLDDSGCYLKLKYVFDFSDTHPGYQGLVPFIWKMETAFQKPVLSHLEDTYSFEARPSSLPDALLELGKTAAAENYPDYLDDFLSSVPGSFLFGLDDLNLELLFRRTLTASVQYTLLKRCGFDPEDYLIHLADSFMISADNAHAVHPAHTDKADPANRPYINGGIVIKFSASQKYCTDGVSAAIFRDLCQRAGVPVQTFVNRSDMAGGSTLGNISNTQVALNTVDIGLPQLAMHSPYETAGVKDTEYLIRAAKECKIPVAVLDDVVKNADVLIVSDDEEGISRAVSYLAGFGHRRIGFFSDGLKEGKFSQIRFTAFQKAMRTQNLEQNPAWNCTLDYYHNQKIREFLAELFAGHKPKPTAFCCASDLIALRVLTSLQRLGIRVPEEVSLIGYGGIHFTELTDPSLTTVFQNFEEMGQSGVKYIMDFLNHKTKEHVQQIIPTRILEGESVAAPNRGERE